MTSSVNLPWGLASAYLALFTGCEIGNDGCGSIRLGGGRKEVEGKKDVDAENKAEDVTAAASLRELAEPIEPEKRLVLKTTFKYTFCSKMTPYSILR